MQSAPRRCQAVAYVAKFEIVLNYFSLIWKKNKVIKISITEVIVSLAEYSVRPTQKIYKSKKKKSFFQCDVLITIKVFPKFKNNKQAYKAKATYTKHVRTNFESL
jgi:hypothetical protein